jgi:hypothetical protein
MHKVKINQRNILVLLIVLLISSCSSTIHMLATWGLPLNVSEKNKVLTRNSKKELSCPELVSLMIREQYKNKEKNFSQSVAKYYSDQESEEILSNINILLSLDYSASFIQLLHFNSTEFNFSKRINVELNEYKFNENFKTEFKSNMFLIKHNNKLDTNLLVEAHNFYDESKKSQIRTISAVEKIPSNESLYPEGTNNIQNNKYLKSEQRKGFLYIHYPSIDHMSDYVKALLKEKKIGLYQEIENYNKKSIGNNDLLNSKLINFLLDDLFLNYKLPNESIKSTKIEKLIISRSVDLYLGLLSIKPFAHHNNKVARNIAFNLLFENKKLIKPRVFISKRPLLYSHDSWTRLVIDGMHKTHEIHEAILKRMELALPIGNTPELYSFVKSFNYSNIYNKKINNIKFKTYARQMIIEDPIKALKLQENPFIYTKHLFTKYIKYMKSYSLNNDSDIYISDDFKYYFNNKSYKSLSTWSHKMDNFYQSQLIWKDIKIIQKQKESIRSEIISYFKKMNSSLSPYVVAGSDLTKSSYQSFDEFNQDAIHGGVNHTVNDFMIDKKNNENSYGFIVYKNLNKLKDHLYENKDIDNDVRIIVGIKKSKKDLDLKKFYKGKSKFKDKAFAIGGIDPDAVMIIHTLNNQGSIVSSYVRDTKRPWQIKYYEGEVSDVTHKGRTPASIFEISP